MGPESALSECVLPVELLVYDLIPKLDPLERFSFSQLCRFFADKDTNPHGICIPLREALFLAASSGHLPFLQFFQTPSSRLVFGVERHLRFSLQYAAVFGGHLPILKWFEEIDPSPLIQGERRKRLHYGLVVHRLFSDLPFPSRKKALLERAESDAECTERFANVMRFLDDLGFPSFSQRASERYRKSVCGEKTFTFRANMDDPGVLHLRGRWFRAQSYSSDFSDLSLFNLDGVLFYLPLRLLFEEGKVPLPDLKPLSELHDWFFFKMVCECYRSKSVIPYSDPGLVAAVLASARFDVLDLFRELGLWKVIPSTVRTLFQSGNTSTVRSIIMESADPSHSSHKNREDFVESALSAALHYGDLKFLVWLQQRRVFPKRLQKDQLLEVIECLYPKVVSWFVNDLQLPSIRESLLDLSLEEGSLGVFKLLVPLHYPSLPTESVQKIHRHLGDLKSKEGEQSQIKAKMRARGPKWQFFECVAHAVEFHALPFNDNLLPLLSNVPPERLLGLVQRDIVPLSDSLALSIASTSFATVKLFREKGFDIPEGVLAPSSQIPFPISFGSPQREIGSTQVPTWTTPIFNDSPSIDASRPSKASRLMNSDHFVLTTPAPTVSLSPPQTESGTAFTFAEMAAELDVIGPTSTPKKRAQKSPKKSEGTFNFEDPFNSQ